MITAYFPQLPWGCKLEVLSFLSIREVWVLGCTNRSAFVCFLRERDSRVGLHMNPHRFLPVGYTRMKLALASYPRSGNSFLRRVIEAATGFVTGSDSRPNRPLTSALLRCGFKGEGICDNSVFVIKTHFPERLGYRMFEATKVCNLF